MNRVLKTIIHVVVLIIIFIVTCFIAAKIMNKDQDNITMERDVASFPIVTIVSDAINYNELHGFSEPQEIGYMNESLTLLGEMRDIDFHIDTYGRNITSISFELRNSYGNGLVESGEVSNFTYVGNIIDGNLALKDLLEEDTEYILTLVLELEEEKNIYFYTNVLLSNDLYFEEKMEFVLDFHNKLFDKEAATDIRRYLETNYSLNDNTSFTNVDIHSSFQQVTYGDLGAQEFGEPNIFLKDISESMITVLLKYIVYTEEEDRIYYNTIEYYRVKKGSERMYLIEYERSMEQIADISKLCQNDKIVLGIVDPDINYMESEDGNTVAFVTNGSLYSYQSTTNKLTQVFAFLGEDEFDSRIKYDAHEIKILDIEESGNIKFAVYGYMNSGRHEGEVGIEIYGFDSKLNTIEELVYIPYSKTAGMLEAELNTLLYLNREQHLYLTLENEVYFVDIDEKKISLYSDIESDDTLLTSADHRILISTKLYENTEFAQSIILTNLKTETDIEIKAKAGDVIRPLGFLDDNVIYGIAHIDDIKTDNSGRYVIPMYRVVICDEEGTLIKEYEYSNYYVTEVSKEENQLTLERVTIDESGRLHETNPDYITTRVENTYSNVTNATKIVDKYETYVQLSLPKTVDSDSLKIVYPKEIVYEGGRVVDIEIETAERFYTYNAYGLQAIYSLASNAVELAEETSGWVFDCNGVLVWKRVDRSTRNQIMAITEDSVTDEKNSLAVCLDSMLGYEGIVRNSNYLLSQGQTVLEILEENLEGYLVIDLKGCTLNSVLYYVNMDTPVLVMTGSDSAVLITGYNDTIIVVLDPNTGALERIAIEEATSWFENCGDEYITYVKK